MNLLPSLRARSGALLFAATLCAGTLASTLSPVSAYLFQDEAKTYTFERKFEKNGVDRYRITLNTQVNGPATNGAEVNIKVKMVMKQTVKEIKDNGSAIVASEFEKATADLGNGEELDALAFLPKVTQTIDKTGRILDSKSEGGQGTGQDIQGMLGQSQALFMPSRPVKIGDKWKIEHRSEKDRTNVVGEATVVKIEKVGDMETLLIKAAADMKAEANANAKGRIEGSANLDPKTGRMVKMNGTLNSDTGPAGKTKADFVFQLLTGKETETGDKKDGDKGR